MADTTVEIFNNTIQWGNYSNNLQTLFTTDGSTRYVVKDVAVDSNSYGLVSPSLLINSTKVASLSGNLTGSEIVDINSTVSISTPATGKYINLITYYPNQSNLYNGVVNGMEFVNTVTGTLSGLSDSMNTVTGLNSNLGNSAGVSYSNCRSFWFLNGNFYYYAFDGNSTTYFMRRAGGVNGSETIIFNSSYTPLAFDGVSKFYYVTGANLYVYDTATSTATYLRNMNYSVTTYSRLAYCAGFLIYDSTYDGSYPSASYHIASGTYSTSIGTPNYNSYTGWISFYDSSAASSQIRIVAGQYTGSSGSCYYTDYTINPDGQTLTRVAGNYMSVPNSHAFYFTAMSSFDSKYYVMLGSTKDSDSYGKMFLVNKNMEVLDSKTIFGADFINNQRSCFYPIPSPTTAQKNAAGPSIKLRITGVKQT